MTHWLSKLVSTSISLSLLLAPTVQAEELPDSNKRKIIEIYDLLSQYHLSGVHPEEVMKSAIEGMIFSTKDPYTEYLTDEQMAQFIDGLNGTYVGIGVLIGEQDGDIMIEKVYDGSPAQQSGFRSGDQIVEINGKVFTDKALKAVSEELLGEEGTTIHLKLKRGSFELEANLQRQKIDLPLVQAEWLQPGIGYIELSSFTEESIAALKEETKGWKDQNMHGLILDLRDNPGGLLTSAVDLVSLFQPEGPVVHVKDRQGEGMTYYAEGASVWKVPLILLVNEYSASASEIVTSALQEYGKATVIGTKTFGKGTVQELIPLETGGVLKMTIEEYFSPKHQRINHLGVAPDILVPDRKEQLQAAMSIFMDNQLSLNDQGEVLINGQLEKGGASAPAAIWEDGKWYISLRKAAYLFHGKLSYDDVNKAVNLQIGNQAHSFVIGQDQHIQVKQGTAYLLLEDLLSQYDRLDFTGDTLLLK